jgi:predicted transglutaminase-like protease
MSNRRLSTFHLLARLEHQRLSRVARKHGELCYAIDRLERQEADLGDRIENEAIATSAETAPYVGTFINAIRAELAHCADQRRTLKQEADVLDEELRQRFREHKVFEIALDRERKAIATEEFKRNERERLETILLRKVRRGVSTKF